MEFDKILNYDFILFFISGNFYEDIYINNKTIIMLIITAETNFYHKQNF